jgi:hypothetical protein
MSFFASYFNTNLSNNSSTNNEIPNQYLCPISLEIMSDPIICQDGYTYDRVSILALKIPLSPMTRQPIDLKVLIPNIALRQIIEQYAETNGIKLKKITPTSNLNINSRNFNANSNTNTNSNNSRADRLANLQREREGMLARFEREQAEQEIQRQNTILREQQEQKRRQQAEFERKRKQEQEDKELERIIAMFNAKDLPEFNIGKYGNTSNGGCWNDFQHGIIKIDIYGKTSTCPKFQFNLENIKKIKQLDENELFDIYKKLCEDLIWIQKYVYGYKDSKPFVDYVYDYKEKNCIGNQINDIQNQINQNQLSHLRCWQCSSNCGYLNTINNLTPQLKELEKLKTILEKLTKSREYYYVNYDEFLDLFGTKNQYGREFERGGHNLDSINGGTYGLNGWSSYSGNSNYHHIFHIWDREKLNKLTFLDVTKKIIDPINYELTMAGYKSYYSDYFYNMEKQFILNQKYGTTRECGYLRNQLINEKDFDKFVKVAKVIVELIEFVRPEIVLMSQEN